MRYLTILSLMLLVAGCGSADEPVADGPTYNIDAERITVSGVSSGAMLATQMHVAHSNLVAGAAMIAGGPYYCAEGNLKKGLGPCMKGGDVGLAALVEYTRTTASTKGIDDPQNLAGDPVWLFHGKNDIAVHADMTAAAAEYYGEFEAQVTSVVDTVDAAHGFPTTAAGAACGEMAAPFLNACDYDAAGELLTSLYGDLQARGTAVAELEEIPQPGASDATMLPSALLYVPASCRDGAACGVHIAFHGCQQSTDYVGDAFASMAGLNEWAETNQLIILYPQVDSSKIAPMNPMGCWDWWGYTDADYATKQGAQIRVVKSILDGLAGKTL